MKEIKRKDGSRVQKNVLYPYTVILGNTIFLKQHEETIMGILVGLYILLIELMPERLKQQGLSC